MNVSMKCDAKHYKTWSSSPNVRPDDRRSTALLNVALTVWMFLSGLRFQPTQVLLVVDTTFSSYNKQVAWGQSLMTNPELTNMTHNCII